MSAKILTIPGGHFVDTNGAVTCSGHRPSSDFHTDPMTVGEVAVWTEFIRDEFGSDVLCELCRAGVAVFRA